MDVLNRLLDRAIDALAMLAGAIIAAIVLALTLNVVLRALFRSGVFGMVDAIEMGIMVTTFIAAPWVLRKNAHVAVDILLFALQPHHRRRVERVTALLGAALSAIVCWAAFRALVIAWSRGATARGVLAVPEWVLLLAPSLGMALLTVVFMRQALSADRSIGASRQGL